MLSEIRDAVYRKSWCAIKAYFYANPHDLVAYEYVKLHTATWHTDKRYLHRYVPGFILNPICTHLQILGGRFTDLSFLQEFPQVRILDLSHNEIEELRFLQNLKYLEQLYLANNNVVNEELKHILHLRELKSLDLYQNPLSNKEQLKQELLNKLPRLKYVFT